MHETGPDFEHKVRALCEPGIWPVPTRSVEVVRTHLACVFLTDAHAFKMKRPIRWVDVNLERLEHRREACEREVRLNRPLAGDVYEGTLALRQAPDGALTFGGAGEIVDWLVRMRRLPDARALDAVIERGELQGRDLDRLAAVLTEFFVNATPIEGGPVRHLERLDRLIRADLETLRGGVDGIPSTMIDAIAREQEEFLEHHGDLVARRVEAGRVVEGHGDLRPEHVYVLEHPVIIDRLELDGDLRALDALSDLTFLALECERLGAPDVGVGILERWCALADDEADPRLLRFYRIQHACTRAKLAVWHLEEPGPRGAAAWVEKARDYLRRAAGTKSIA
jgi:uncharacterized protein